MVTVREMLRFLDNEVDLQMVINSSLSSNITYLEEAVASVFPQADVTANTSVPLTAVAATLFYGSRSVLCPKVDARHPASSMARVTAPGCPCNFSTDAAFNRCPSGYACSRRGFLGLSTDAYFDPTWGQLRAVCVPCYVGQYCAEGTLANITTGITKVTRTLDCPAGHYCPSPGQAILCPAGSYCVSRALNYTTCNMTDLLNAPDALVPADAGGDIITRLKRNREPLRGNYCPPGSTKSGTACAGGYYCPNASVQLPCPANHYCKPQSIYPVKCPWLTRCPEGSSAPDGRPLAGLIFGLVVICIYLSKWVAQLAYFIVERVMRLRYLLTRLRAGLANQVDEALGLGVDRIELQDAFDIHKACEKDYWRLAEKNNIRFNHIRGQYNRKPAKRNEDPGISGIFVAGELSAIMGPSGCGKTTLIKILSGRVPAQVTAFNEERQKVALTETRYRRKLGYVPQDDILHSDLTVRENLAFSAQLKLPLRTPYVARSGIVEDTLRMLGMYDKQDSIVGSVERPVISGGERKRVSIGVEIVSKPPILFMDEPTSGLDAARSSELINILSELANAAKTNIITVIHQPRYSSFIKFDKLLLLAKGGKVLFMGPPKLAMPYFQTLGFPFDPAENFADTILDIVAQSSAIRSKRGIRNSELSYVWTARGEAWTISYNRPIERWRRTANAIILERRMQRLGFKDPINAMEAADRARVRASLRAAELERARAAVAAANLNLEGPPATSVEASAASPSQVRAVAPGSDPAALQGAERRRWLNNKLRKVFPKYKQDAAYLESQKRDMKKYEHELHRSSSSSEDSDTDPDTDSDDGSDVDDEAVILLLRHPNKGNRSMVKNLSRIASGRGTDFAALAASSNDALSWLKYSYKDFHHHTATLLYQLAILFNRNVIKATRAFWPGTVLDVLLLLGAAFIVGAVQGSKWGLSNVPSNASMTYLVLSVLSAVVHLRTFSVWRNVQLRERMSGVSALATFLSSNAWDMCWIVLSPAVYLSVYYFIVLPRAGFLEYYIIGVLVCFWSSGMSYVISISTIPPQAQLITTVILSLILGAFLHGLSPSIKSARGNLLEVILGLSYNRWAMEGLTIQEFRKYFEYKSNEIIMIYYNIGLCRMDKTLLDDGNDEMSVEEALSFVSLWSTFTEGYCDKYYTQAITVLSCMGVGMRVVAFGQLFLQTHSQWFQIKLAIIWRGVEEVTGIDLAVTSVQELKASIRERLRALANAVVLKKAQGGAAAARGSRNGVSTVGVSVPQAGNQARQGNAGRV